MLRLASYPHKGDYKPNPWKPEVIQEVPVLCADRQKRFR